MKIKGTGKPRTPNPANPLKDNQKEKQKTYYIDFDGTIAYYDPNGNSGDIGEPIPGMLDKINNWIKQGIKIKIFTGRANIPESIKPMKLWLKLNGFPELEITNTKGIDHDLILDDKAREVIFNTGVICDRTGDI